MKFLIFGLLLIAGCSTTPVPPPEKAVLTLTNNLEYSDLKTSLRLCNDNNFKECERAAVIYKEQKNENEAKALFAKACTNKIGTSCFHLGTFQPDNATVESGMQNVKYFAKGCELNEPFSCYYFAKLVLALTPDPSIPEANKVKLIESSKNFLTTACARKVVSACKLLESNLKPYTGQKADEVRDMCTAGLFGSGCEVAK